MKNDALRELVGNLANANATFKAAIDTRDVAQNAVDESFAVALEAEKALFDATASLELNDIVVDGTLYSTYGKSRVADRVVGTVE